MSLEQCIADLTAAVKELVTVAKDLRAAPAAKQDKTAAAPVTAATKMPASPPAPPAQPAKVTLGALSELRLAAKKKVNELAAAKGSDEARAVIAEIQPGATNITGVAEESLQAFIEAADKALLA